MSSEAQIRNLSYFSITNMNIKFVYKQNVHKVPPSAKTLQDILKAIESIYPISATLIYHSPEGELVQISENAQLQSIFSQHKNIARSIKFLVVGKNEQQIPQEDLILLNQSMVLAPEDKFADCLPFNQEVQQAAQVPIQNEKLSLGELLQQPSFQYFLDRYFDERLKTCGIYDEIKALHVQQEFMVASLQNMEQWKEASQQALNQLKKESMAESPHFSSEYLRAQTLMQQTVNPGTHFVWDVGVKNSGFSKWPQQVFVKCISGPYNGATEKVPSLGTQQTGRIQIPLESLHQTGSYFSIWRLCYLDKNSRKELFFGEEMSFHLTVVNGPLNPLHQTVPLRYQAPFYENLVKKARDVQTILKDEPLEKLCVFLDQHKLQDYDTLGVVDQYLNINEGQQKYQYPPLNYHKPKWGVWPLFKKSN